MRILKSFSVSPRVRPQKSQWRNHENNPLSNQENFRKTKLKIKVKNDSRRKRRI